MTKFLQELCEQVFVNEVDDAAQVICTEHETYICTGSVDAFFCGDVVEAPLSFEYAIVVFNN